MERVAGEMTEPSPSSEAARGPVLLMDDEPAVRGLFKRVVRSARRDTIDATDGIGRRARLPPGGGGRLRPNRSSWVRRSDLAGEDGSGLARDEVSHRVPLQGSREEEALAEHATELPEPPELGRRLDPFGHGRQAERTPDFDDRTDDTGSPTRIVERSHERPVDLDMGNGETLQVGQRRVSGPKVVDGNMNAQAADGVQLFEGGGAVVHQQALGELESNPARGRASVSHGRLKSPGEPWVGELMGRDVDRHAGHPAGGKLSPSGGFGARGPKDPRTRSHRSAPSARRGG